MTEPHEPITIIQPPKRFEMPDLAEAWAARDLFRFLAWRDVMVRYKQTVAGAAWAVIQPFLQMVIFSVIFSVLAKIPSEGLPYPVFSFTALLPWQFFSKGVSGGSESMTGNAHILTKIYFPRLLMPLASLAPAVVDFAIAFLMLVAMMLYYHLPLRVEALLLPLFFLLALVFTVGLGLWFSAANVRYRDIRHVVPFFVQFWMYVSPVTYPSSMIPGPWRIAYGLNPMAGVVEGFRWALLGIAPPPPLFFAGSAATAVLLLVTGALYFRNSERQFADVV